MPRSFFDDRALVFDDGTFEEVPDVEADRGAHSILMRIMCVVRGSTLTTVAWRVRRLGRVVVSVIA